MAKRCSVRNPCSHPRADWWRDALYGTGVEEEEEIILLPDYASLTGLELLVDYTGLVVGTTNAYGIVDGSGNVTTLKSLAPSPLTRDFVSNGTAPTLAASGIVFGGAGRLRAGVDSKTWANFMSYNAVTANLKWTVHAVVKFGTSIDPGVSYGLLGNVAGSGANKGIAISFSDPNTTLNNGITSQIANGGANICLVSENDAAIPNDFFVLTIETDMSLPTATKKKIYVNNILLLNIPVTASGNPATTPTYDLELGGYGNAVGPLLGAVKELTIQSAISTSVVRTAFITALINKHSVETSYLGITKTPSNTYDIFSDGRYPLTSNLIQSTSNPLVIVQVFADWTLGHIFRTTNQLSMRRSTDGGATWGSKIVLYNTLSVMDCSTGIDPDTGTMHIFADAHDGAGTTEGTTKSLIHLTSTDDGLNWATEDLSSLISFMSADTQFRAYGKMIKNGSVLMFLGYSAETDTNPNTIHLFRKDGAAAWAVITVEANTTNFRTESSIIALSATHVMVIARDEVTEEYVQYMSTDNGLIFTNQGAQTFGGESYAFASPMRLKKFQISGVDVIVAYVADRNNRRIRAIYGKATDLVTNGLTGWTTTTKITIQQHTTGQVPEYPDYLHYNNDINCLYSVAIDDGTGGAAITSVIHVGILPTWHLQNIKTLLGI